MIRYAFFFFLGFTTFDDNIVTVTSLNKSMSEKSIETIIVPLLYSYGLWSNIYQSGWSKIWMVYRDADDA